MMSQKRRLQINSFFTF